MANITRAARGVSALGQNTWRVVASTPGVARDGLAIPTASWDTSSYEANPILLWAHARDDLDAVLGQAVVRKTPDALEADIQFLAPGVSDFADKVSRLWEAGILRAVSVGAAIRATEPAGGHLVVTDAELLDISIVPIGGDSAALSRVLGENFELSAADIARVFHNQPTTTQARPRLFAAHNRYRLLESRRR